MEGVGEKLIVESVESKTMEELKGEMAEAYKTIAEKAENQRLLEKEHFQSGGVADGELGVRPSPIPERKAEEIIPKECWGLVFQNLDVEDLFSCRQVCKTFNQLLDLQEFKVKWKFHLILPLLFPYLQTIQPDRFPSWANLYNVRLVCQSWRHSIGKYASEVYGNDFLVETNEIPLLTSFGTSEDIEEFQQRFRDCNTNPFPSRSVCIGNSDKEGFEDDDYTQDYYNAYNEKIGELLEQFGKHIFRIHLYFNEQVWGPDNLTLCKLIKDISTHAPNLREFFINGQRQPNEDDEEVALFVAENAVAALPKLQALTIGGLDKKVDDYLLDALGPQLTHLWASSSENLKFPMQQLKNLRKLRLLVLDPSDTLEPLGFLQSPLERLKLTCIFGERDQGTWNMDKVLRNLKHLPILEVHIICILFLRVNLPEAGIDIEEYKNASIKTLIIHIHHVQLAEGNVTDRQISFNFLQALTKLENLELKISGNRFRTTHPEELPEVVKLNEYLGEEGTERIYHSNVWEKVPSLKTLTLARKVDQENEFVKSIYTREKYERMVEEDGPERN